MNSDNFNNNLNQNGVDGGKNIPRYPQNLSKKQRAFFVVGATLFMLICSVINIFGLSSGDSVALIGSGTLSMLVYIMVGGVCALLVLDCPKLAAIPPLLSLVASLVIFFVQNGKLTSVGVLGAVQSLFPAICGVIIAVSMKRGARRSGAILAGAVGLALFTVALFTVGSLLEGQSIGVEYLLAAIEEARQGLIASMTEMAPELSETLGYDVSGLDFESVVNSVFNILPALVILTFTISAFVAQLSLLALCRICGIYHKLEKKDTEFSVTPITALIYAITALLGFFIPDGQGAAAAVLENLNIILMPALALVGLMSFLPRREGNVVRIGCFPLVILVILLMTAPIIAILLLSAVGAFGTLKRALKLRKNNKSN